ncbi:MAG: hypothetical protein QG653_496 [Patescibacteria group bacterium]|nr:hypothetical protein [Patescibacteria group bacterium]
MSKYSASCAQGGTRTHTHFNAKDFKSFMSTIPSPGRVRNKIATGGAGGSRTREWRFCKPQR